MSELLKECEVAKMIGLSVYWLRKMRWAGGGIPFVKIESAVRYRKEDVEAFCMARVRKSTSDIQEAA